MFETEFDRKFLVFQVSNFSHHQIFSNIISLFFPPAAYAKILFFRKLAVHLLQEECLNTNGILLKESYRNVLQRKNWRNQEPTAFTVIDGKLVKIAPILQK